MLDFTKIKFRAMMHLQTDQLHGRAKLGDKRNRESTSVNE